MKKQIAHITLMVRDYDEAIQFYTEKLDFKVIRDVVLDEKKRWVLVAPESNSECCLLLAKSDNEEQSAMIGNQTGGRVFLFLHTDDFWRDYKTMLAKGILFTRDPVTEGYGTVGVFKDLYGNLWDLIEPKELPQN